MHSCNFSEHISEEHLVYEVGFEMGFVQNETDGVRTHYILPKGYKELQISTKCLLSATQSIIPDVQQYECDLGGLGFEPFGAIPDSTSGSSVAS